MQFTGPVATGGLYVGYQGTATMTVNTGATVSAPFAYIGAFATGTGMVAVDGAGATLTMSDNLSVGRSGSGMMAVVNGGHVFTNNGFIAFNPGSAGSVSISGAGSAWTVSSSVYVGGTSSIAGGAGSLTISNSGSLSLGSTLKLWGGGTLNLNGGGAIFARSVDISTGTFNFTGGTLNVSAGLFTGSGPLTIAGPDNPVLILATSGVNATMTGVTTLTVGNGNSGGFRGTANIAIGGSGAPTSLVVQSGGTATFDATLSISAGGTIALATGGAITAHSFQDTAGTFNFTGGTLTVSGGAYTQTSGTLTISGANGPTLVLAAGATASGVQSVSIGTAVGQSGSLSIMGGSVLTSSGVVNIAFATPNGGAIGAATVSGTSAGGTASQWNVGANLLNVGNAGAGSLLISGGGLVTGTIADIGNSNLGTGVATVSGASAGGTASQWIISSGLTIGNLGTGYLTITGGGLVSSGAARLGDQMTTALGNVTISGASTSGTASLWTITTSLTVGASGLGNVNVVNGGKLSLTGSSSFGAVSTGIGAATVSGTGSTWTQSSDMFLGGNNLTTRGTGSITVNSSGSLVVGGTLKLWGNGTLMLDSGGSITAGTFDRTVAGNIFNFNGGTLTISGGRYAQASGPLTIDGTNNPLLVLATNVTNATLSGVTTLTVGNGGGLRSMSNFAVGSTGAASTLVVQNGGTATFDATLSISAGGVVTLAGGAITAGSFQDTAGTFNFTGGTLTVSGGAYTQAVGTLAVSGANSPAFVLAGSATTTGVVDVVLGAASANSGSLSILSGAKLNATGAASIASASGSVGAATISGIGSTWTIGSNLYVGGGLNGAGGAGSLNVSSGGTVYVGGTTTVFAGSQLNIAGGGTFSTSNFMTPGQLTNNGQVNTSVTIAPGGTLAGTGTISGNVTMGSGSTYAPGNSPGMQTVNGDVTWNSLTYSMEIAAVTGAQGVGYDSLDINAALPATGKLTIADGATINIDLSSYPSNTNVADFNYLTPFDLILVSTDGGVQGFNTAIFNVHPGAFAAQNPLNGGVFSVLLRGNNVLLHFAAVPEPGSLLLATLGVGAFATHVRRRRRTSTPSVPAAA